MAEKIQAITDENDNNNIEEKHLREYSRIFRRRQKILKT